MQRHDNDETQEAEIITELETQEGHVVTPVSERTTAETIRITGEAPAYAPDMLRFGRGRYRTVELTVKNPDHIFSIRSEDAHDIVIGRHDAEMNYTPIVDLTPFGGKLFGVSRRHATLNNHNGVLYIVDHNTKNGTYVNGIRIETEKPHVLTNGDRLQIGRLQLMVRFTDKVLAT
ncbi:MAG: FHA domain-containing protein [Chloroflexota bacterium]